MELLLNLTWLLVALPAYWLWRDSRHVALGRRMSSAQSLLALACMLVVLFPVVSATDDLHAMRTEMEESGTGKRSLAQKGGEKPCSWKWQTPPALTQVSGFFFAPNRRRLDAPDAPLPVTAHLVAAPAGRAPPFLRA